MKSCCIRKAPFKDCDVYLPDATLYEWLDDTDNNDHDGEAVAIGDSVRDDDVGHVHDGDDDAVARCDAAIAADADATHIRAPNNDHVRDDEAAPDAEADAAHIKKESDDAAAKNMDDEDLNTFEGFLHASSEHLED